MTINLTDFTLVILVKCVVTKHKLFFVSIQNIIEINILFKKVQRIIIEQSERSGKSPEIVKKMAQGRITKFLNEITLMGQPFVKDPVKSVGEILKNVNVRVSEFIRYEVVEGIEKKENDFVEEVIRQITENKK